MNQALSKHVNVYLFLAFEFFFLLLFVCLYPIVRVLVRTVLLAHFRPDVSSGRAEIFTQFFNSQDLDSIEIWAELVELFWSGSLERTVCPGNSGL